MRRPTIHLGLFFATLFLLSVGLILIYSTSAIYAQERYGDAYYFLKRHGIYSGLSLGALFIILKLPLELFKKISYPILFLGLIFMIGVFIPGVGHRVGIASRWIRLGFFQFQPAEFMKLAMIFYFSYILTEKDWSQRIFIKLIPHFFVVSCVLFFLYYQPDFGNFVIVSLITGFMIFIAGVKVTYVVVAIVVSCPFLYSLAYAKAYRRKRILSFLNPWDDPKNSGYQVLQSFLAFFEGGFLGQGLGGGRSKLFYLPQAHNDFIYASLGEELGFLGCIVVLFTFFYIVHQGIRIALSAPSPFFRCLTAGITFMIGVEALLNMAVVLGLLPTKGLPLPFISYGGTSLVINVIAIGILLKISQFTKENAS
ncbi:MAG: putative lipid II flippase FtsW [Deltaproteobacteria bacterium]|nr:putative lipid II flippase FtsW [Deltaproteobacteria bacterium]